MLEFDPSEDQKRVMNECFRCRGLMVSSYAHVEFLLADLCFKSWRLEPYRPLASRFPYKATTRELAVKAILSVENGPLFQFKEPAVPLLNKWRDSERDRNIMAHGLMRIEWHRDNIFVHGQLLRTRSDGGADLETIRWSIGTLQAKTRRASVYSQGWIKLCHAMHSRMGWISPKGAPVQLAKSNS
jgi:hypothetical protein